jgi:hypothetical protein
MNERRQWHPPGFTNAGRDGLSSTFVTKAPPDPWGSDSITLLAQATTWLDEEGVRHYASRVSNPSHDWCTEHTETYLLAARQLRRKYEAGS